MRYRIFSLIDKFSICVDGTPEEVGIKRGNLYEIERPRGKNFFFWEGSERKLYSHILYDGRTGVIVALLEGGIENYIEAEGYNSLVVEGVVNPFSKVVNVYTLSLIDKSEIDINLRSKVPFYNNLAIWGSSAERCGIGDYCRKLSSLLNVPILGQEAGENVIQCWDIPTRDNYREVIRVVRENGFDVLHVQLTPALFDYRALGIVLEQLRRLGVRLVSTHHVLSPNLKSLFDVNITGVPKEGYTFIPIGLEDFEPCSEILFDIGSCGFLLPHKGFHNIIPRLSGLRYVIYSPLHPSHLEVGCKNGYYDFILEQAGAYNQEVVIDTTFYDYRTLNYLLSQCGAIILPYTSDMGQVSSSALATAVNSKRPVFTTDLEIFRAYPRYDIPEDLTTCSNFKPQWSRRWLWENIIFDYEKAYRRYGKSFHFSGYINDIFSFAHVNRQWLSAAEKLGADITTTECLPNRSLPGVKLPSNLEYVVQRVAENKNVEIHHTYPPRFEFMDTAKFNVMMMPWEVSRIPECWVDKINEKVDLLIVPTKFVYDAFANSGVCIPIHIVRYGVDHSLFNPVNAARNRIFDFGMLTLLHVGNIQVRKGTDYLFQAYNMAFSDDDDVILFVKSYDTGHVFSSLVPKTDKRWIYWCSNIDDEKLVGLYGSCDILVVTSLGEGACLPIVEMMACGKPVLVSSYTGAPEWLNGLSCPELWKFDCIIEPANWQPKIEGACWGVPVLDSLVDRLRWVYDNRDFLPEYGQEFLELSYQYSWERMAKEILDLLR